MVVDAGVGFIYEGAVFLDAAGPDPTFVVRLGGAEPGAVASPVGADVEVVATLGSATSSEKAITELVRAGVDVTRFNFSHGSHDVHLKNAQTLREAAKETGRNVAILQDIQGPKIRTDEVEGGTELIEGSQVVIAPGDFVGDASPPRGTGGEESAFGWARMRDTMTTDLVTIHPLDTIEHAAREIYR